MPKGDWPPPHRRWNEHLTLGHRFAAFLWSVIQRAVFPVLPSNADPTRLLFMRLFGARVDIWTSVIHPSVQINYPWNLTIGRNVLIEHKVILNATSPIHIHAGTRVSQYAHLCTAMRDYENPAMPLTGRPIVIGEDVWLAADAFVGPGVTIGARSVVGARASVFEDLPPDVVAVGEPAAPIKLRPRAPGVSPDAGDAGNGRRV